MPCCSSGSREFLTDQAPAVMDKINQCLFFFFFAYSPPPPSLHNPWVSFLWLCARPVSNKRL